MVWLLVLPLLFAAATERGPCYRRRNINLKICTHTGGNYGFSLYTRDRAAAAAGALSQTLRHYHRSAHSISWTEHPHTNCCCGSNIFGADNILPEPFSASLSLSDCQAGCQADSNCTAVIWRKAALPLPPAPPTPPTPPPAPGAFDWIKQIEDSSGSGKFRLNATVYLIDRQYQLPAGTELRGAAGGGTVIRAVGPPFSSNCGANAKNRKGFLLGDNTFIGGFHYVSVKS